MANLTPNIVARFHYTQTIKQGECIELKGNLFNHLAIVLRCTKGQYITLFNEINGEFVAEIQYINKNSIICKISNQIKKFNPRILNIHLAYAPLKKSANDFVIEKATELDVDQITQVITKRTIANPIKHDKMTIKVIQAAQQCGRIDIPKINQPEKLEPFINQLKAKNHIICWLDTQHLGTLISEYKVGQITQNITLLIGPEGGFSEEERRLLLNNPKISPVYLNTNILRAETASVAAMVALLSANSLI